MSHPPPRTLQVLDWSIPVLGLAQSVSACSFSLFSLVHLSAPLTALLPSRPKYLASPENRANGFLLLGRELYQGQWSEPVWVYASLSVHVLAGVANRWLKLAQATQRRKWKRRCLALELDDDDAPSPTTADTRPLKPALTTHHVTGYVLVPIVLHHVWLHRILPASPAPPISALSPSFFNYTFTAEALTNPSRALRVASAASYAALTALAVYHALVGLRILADPTAPRSLAPKRRRRSRGRGRAWQAAWTAVVVGVGVGTARIAGAFGAERIGTHPDWIAKRMDYVLRRGWGLT
ncbi:hypothetical protein JCM11491_004678 [Sporobolomyces phaffii]